MNKKSQSSSERRAFLTSLNAAAASVTAMAVGSVAFAQTKSTTSARWEPARHEKDDWLDKPSRHRLLFDTTTFQGIGEALAFAGNFIRVNQSEYGVPNDDLSVVIVVRHQSAPFGYNDAMWAKYGKAIAPEAKVEDPKTKLAPKTNIFNASDYGTLLPNRGTTLESITKLGVQLAVCTLSTRRFAGAIADAVGGNADAINNELRSNLVTNGRMVPAGIVTVARAQEHSYSLVRA